VGRYIFNFKKPLASILFFIIYSLWSIYFSLPQVGVQLIFSSNTMLQFLMIGISFIPALFYILYIIYLFFNDQNKIPRRILLILISGLVIPLIVVYELISIQLSSTLLSVDLTFISLSLSIYFFTYVIHLEKNINLFKSFKDKVLIAISLLVLIPLTVRTSYIFINSQRILKSSITKSFEYEIEYLSYDLESILSSLIRDIKVIAEFNDFFTIEDEESREEVEDFLLAYLENSKYVSKISFYNMDGFEVLSVNNNQGFPSISQENDINNYLNDQFFTNLEGKDIHYVYISPFNLPDGLGGTKVNFSTHVYNGNKKVGLLLFQADSQEIFTKFFNNNQYILDENGYYLYHSDIQNVLDNRNINQDLPNIWNEIKDLDKVITSQYNDNYDYVYSFRPLDISFDSQKRSIYILHQERANILYEEINSFSIIILATSLMVSLITFIFVYLTVNYLTRPLETLKNAVENFNDDNRNIFNQKSSLEIEEVSKSFLLLLEKLDKSQIEVKEKVKNQTQEIDTNAKSLEKQRLAMINLIEDIDNQRQLNLQQALDLKKFKLAIDSVSELIVITDNNGIVIYVNPIVYEITGFKADEAIGSKAGVLWGRQMPKEWYENFWNIISVRKEKFSGKITNVRKDGEKYISLITVNPLVDDIGNVQYFISTQRDITREVKIDRMKTDFISLASHQLRTPLSAMKWFLEMLMNKDFGSLSESQIDVVKNIDNSNSRMISLVNSLLNVSRIESGRIMVNPSSIKISGLIKKVIQSVKKDFEKNNQSIILKVDSSINDIVTDKELLSQVILNLLTNASKYTQSGGSIVVSVGKKDEFVYIKVADNGYGIPKDEQKNIFNRFYRATNIVKNVTDGTGLGLYLAKIIMETLDGKIGFISHENKGSIFWVAIPFAGIKKKEGEVSLAVSDE